MSEKLGHYEIIEELGRGGMGRVLKARDPNLDREVAIKVLAENVQHDERLISRFLREARSVARLNHPNIIQIYFVGEEASRHYFVMEFVKGFSLAERIAYEQTLDPSEAAQIVLQCARGLSAAHKAEVIHRDIKPANIMLNESGQVKLADFGIAYMPDPNEKLTETGHFLGTPGYLSPEICLGKVPDNRSDIFSLGIVFYEMLVGDVPFKGDSLLALLRQVVESDIPDVRKMNDAVDHDLYLVFMKMIAKDPESRYQSCDALADDLQAYFDGKPIIHAKNLAGVNAVDMDAPTVAVTSAVADAITRPIEAEEPLPPTVSDQVPPELPAAEPPTPPETLASTSSIDIEPVATPPVPPTMVKPAQMPPKKSGGGLLLVALLILGFAGLGTAGYFAYDYWGSGRNSDDVAVQGNMATQEGEQGQDGTTIVDQSDSNVAGVSPDEFNSNNDNRSGTYGDVSSSQLENEDQDNRGDGDSTGDTVEGVDDTLAGRELVADNDQTVSNRTDDYENSSAPGSNIQTKVQDESMSNEDTYQRSLADRALQPSVTDPPVDTVTSAEQKQSSWQAKGQISSQTNASDSDDASPRDDQMNRDSTPATVDSNKMAIYIRGEPDVADVIDATLVDYLSSDDYKVFSSNDIPSLRNLSPNVAPDPMRLGSGLADRGFSKLIMAEIRITGQRDLAAGRNRSTAYSASVTLGLYNTMTGRRIGRAIRKSLEFTSLNLERNAEKTALELYHDLVNILDK